MMKRIMLVATDARHFSPGSFGGDEPESESEEEEEESDVEEKEENNINVVEHAERENGLYVSPLGPPPTRAKLTACDRQIDP